jgi:hypothetical protein
MDAVASIRAYLDEYGVRGHPKYALVQLWLDALSTYAESGHADTVSINLLHNSTTELSDDGDDDGVTTKAGVELISS